MLVYLTSIAAKTLDKLIILLPRSPSNMKVAFISTAGDLYDNPHLMEYDKKNLLLLGFIVEEVDIKNKAPEELNIQLSDKDIIFLRVGICRIC